MTAAVTTPVPVDAIAAPDARRGIILGTIGVIIFGFSVPMTRLATGTPGDPQLPGTFIAFGRAVIAGLLSVAYLVATRAPWPERTNRIALTAVAGGVVLGFPLGMSVAMRYVDAVHGSAILGALPLGTAVIGAWVNHQRPPAAFWAVAVIGSLLVIAFPFVKAGASITGMNSADVLLIGAAICASTGYVFGARVARTMTAEQVICWGCALALPVTLPLSYATWPEAPASVAAWMAFAFLGIGSMWIGFFFWYRGLAIGGTVRVSQVQLVQPMLGMVFSVPLLGETLDLITVAFGLAIVGTVFVGRRVATRT